MKKGFTLIELIFTIVILAITTMAIPRIVAQTTELNALAIKEELVYNAKALMSRVSKAQWDSAYMGSATCDSDPSCMERILTVANELPEGSSVLRPGILNEPNNRKVNDQAPTPKKQFGKAGLSIGGGSYNEIDDYDGFVTRIRTSDLVGSSSKGDFVLDTNISIAVDYIADPFTPADYESARSLNGVLRNTPNDGTPTNIKMVSVTASDVNDPIAKDGAPKGIVLRTYLTNIGVGGQTTVSRYVK